MTALNVDDLIEGLDRARRGRVEERATELIAEENDAARNAQSPETHTSQPGS